MLFTVPFVTRWGVLRASVLVHVLHDLGLARARAERLAEGLGGQIPGGVEVGPRLGAAERARGGQAGPGTRGTLEFLSCPPFLFAVIVAFSYLRFPPSPPNRPAFRR